MPEPSTSLLQSSVDRLQRGQSLEAEGRFDEALSLYDQAIAAGRTAPRSDYAARRLLGVAWMNRGNALQRMGTAVGLTDAIGAYDAAIAVFETLPVAAEPLFRNHLGAAWLNRGHALLVAGNTAGIASFEQAIGELQQLPLDADPYYRLNLAGAWTNLAHALIDAAPERARSAAHSAIAILANVEQEHDAFAAMSLRARRALVMAIGELLRRAAGVSLVGAENHGQDARATPAELIAEATDAIEDGLAIAREFETRGSTELRPLALRLFRLGAQIYGAHQPHFLGEFLLEQLAAPAFASDAEFRSAAEQALTHALVELQRPQLFVAGTPEATKALATFGALRDAQQRLSALPLSPLPASSA